MTLTDPSIYAFSVLYVHLYNATYRSQCYGSKETNLIHDETHQR